MRKLTLVTITLIFFMSLSAYADTIHVPADYETIQAAIDATENGDTVLVVDGTYTGDGNRGIDFNGKAITLQLQNGADNCIIDCQNNDRGFCFHSQESSGSVVDGFTITNGFADFGGGIYCNNSFPTITNNIITNNSSSHHGGGINCLESNPTITNNTLTGNSSTYGGGIYCEVSSSPTIAYNNIINNSATLGAGICCDNSSPTINDNIISKNIADDNGGGIRCHKSSPLIENNDIIGNSADYGGGIYVLKHQGGEGRRIYIYDIHFISSEKGWAIDGSLNDYWTNDGGETWTPINDLGISSEAFFLNALDGWQWSFVLGTVYHYPPVGWKIKFKRTHDGGLSWSDRVGTVTKVIELNKPPKSLNHFPGGGVNFYFLSSLSGFAIGSTPFSMESEFVGNYIARTTDGGKTWTLYVYWGEWLASSIRNTIQFVDEQHGWAIMDPPLALYRTRDGGRSWEALQYPRSKNKRADINLVAFASPQVGWLSLKIDGLWELWTTNDGGINWRKSSENSPVFDILFLNPQQGWMLSFSNRILSTKDGGKTWNIELDLTDVKKGGLINLSYDKLTHTLWATGYPETIYKRTTTAVRVFPRGKFPSSWGELKQLR